MSSRGGEPLPRAKISFERVRQMALELPGVEEGKSYGSPALKVRGQVLASLPTHKSAEPDSLAVRIDFEQRDGLVADAPEIYYVKEHYQNYPIVLVRLGGIQPEQLRELLGAAWRFVTTTKRRGERVAAPRMLVRASPGRR